MSSVLDGVSGYQKKCASKTETYVDFCIFMRNLLTIDFIAFLTVNAFELHAIQSNFFFHWFVSTVFLFKGSVIICRSSDYVNVKMFIKCFTFFPIEHHARFLLFLHPDFNVLDMCFEIFISFKFCVLYQIWMQTAINLQLVYLYKFVRLISLLDGVSGFQKKCASKKKPL